MLGASLLPADIACSKTFPDEEEQEEVRQGFNPDRPVGGDESNMHNTDIPFTIGEEPEDDPEEQPRDQLGSKQPWESRKFTPETTGKKPAEYDGIDEERNAWSGREDEE